MNFFNTIFNSLLYRPLFNGLILLYTYLPGSDFGIAIIVLTILLRIVLSPFMAQTIKSQKAISEIQPKIQEIQEKFKDDQERQIQEITNLYQEKKINPLNMFLPLLIQLPLLIALFQVFSKGLKLNAMDSLYGFVPHPGEINYTFLGLMNLSQPNIILAVFSAVSQFFQLKMQNFQTKKAKNKNNQDRFSKTAQNQMPYFLSAFTFVFLSRIPAALGLYWMATSLFSIGHQYILKNHDESD
jgi:YidC/Oxa1 family membrane protein insertase